jgi:hypothetical protein
VTRREPPLIEDPMFWAIIVIVAVMSFVIWRP